MKQQAKPASALDYVHNRYIEGRPEMVALLEDEESNADIALRISELRTNAGLSQRDLAQRIGTTASVISRLESANYRGHSLTMLRRIATALDKRVEIQFV